MLKIKKNIEALLLLAIPLLVTPILFLLNCREYWLSALFFVLSVISVTLLQTLSLKFFKNIIPAIAGGTLVKIVLLTIIVFIAASNNDLNHTRMIISFVLAFIIAKIYEIRTLNYLTNSKIAQQESKQC